MFRDLNNLDVFWYESGTNQADCSRKVASGRRVAGVVRFLVNDRSLQLECVRFCMSHCWCLFLRKLVMQ